MYYKPGYFQLLTQYTKLCILPCKSVAMTCQRIKHIAYRLHLSSMDLLYVMSMYWVFSILSKAQKHVSSLCKFSVIKVRIKAKTIKCFVIPLHICYYCYSHIEPCHTKWLKYIHHAVSAVMLSKHQPSFLIRLFQVNNLFLITARV